jgi:hypothetical protein
LAPDSLISNLSQSVQLGEPVKGMMTLAALQQLRYRLGTTARLLPLAMLHLDQKVEVLEDAGIATLGALVDKSPEDLMRLPGLGKSAVTHIAGRLEQIGQSVDSQGCIDWRAFCKAASLPLLPSGSGPRSGSEFLTLLSPLAEELAHHLADPLERAILVDRLTRPREEQRTLEELARGLDVPLTRERVRQREKRLLDSLSEALLFGEYSGLALHFDPDFSSYWAAAMRHLPADGEMTFEAFCQCLCSCWEVTLHELFAHLPFITAVLTSRSQAPPSLRAAKGVTAQSFAKLGISTKEMPIYRLPLGRHAGELDQAGLNDIGALIEALRFNRLGQVRQETIKEAGRLLHALNNASTAEGAIDWQVFADLAGFSLIPSIRMDNASVFMATVRDNVAQALAEGRITARSVDIFNLRTCKPRAERPTLETVGRALSVFGSGVKREETQFLKALNAQLVQLDMSVARVFYRPEFLDYWSESARIYQASAGSYDRFVLLLQTRWGLSAREVAQGAPTLWAVIDGYPRGKPRRRAVRHEAGVGVAAPLVAGGVVKLRGFRRVH